MWSAWLKKFSPVKFEAKASDDTKDLLHLFAFMNLFIQEPQDRQDLVFLAKPYFSYHTHAIPD